MDERKGVGDNFAFSFLFFFEQALLTRKNHLTGVLYKDDPTILAWELINEPRCITDPTGNTLQVSRCC